ncbi:unnamed protein product (macronuclear) [Paramecium tetraurelia]|uniref:Rab-GAP TBC domain-containing protein n=1 Tax=Paramecium tetraurelia TaxID=5888 RepID=A0CX43_PARTE|nr:uncharacterized protein GSPATT00001564001 [Paramecium tetraurelia]CAK75360.1 unnamed protein product [Paramecium tetraurelia]|eukprot:XP_001442757.1 hypothetical protein (macronuclear) [Paramecium tetraurelia strain d4-2]
MEIQGETRVNQKQILFSSQNAEQSEKTIFILIIIVCSLMFINSLNEILYFIHYSYRLDSETYVAVKKRTLACLKYNYLLIINKRQFSNSVHNHSCSQIRISILVQIFQVFRKKLIQGSLQQNDNLCQFLNLKDYSKYSKSDIEKKQKLIWQEIAQDWQKYQRDVKVIQLAEFGIPFSARRFIWPLIVGNKHQITLELFEILSEQVQNIIIDDKYNYGRISSMKLIQKDLGRTFDIPSLRNIFQSGGPLSGSLQSILESFCVYRPDIGYIQGMTYIASILLTYLDEYQTFIIFSSLITHPQLLPIYLVDSNLLQVIFQQFQKLIKINIPQTYQILKQYNIDCSNFLLEWIITLYAKTLNPDIVGRIWDMMFFNGTNVLWKTGISILKLLSSKFKDLETTLLLLKYPQVNEDELFYEINLVKYPVDVSEILSNLQL